MNEKIFQADLFIGGAELKLIEDAIERRWLTEGKYARQLLDTIRETLSVKHAMFAPNGTLGLFLATLGLELEPGSEILMPSLTFYGTATSARYAGLKPVFVDVDPHSFNATPAAYEAAITPNTRAIMPVHLFGHCGDIAGIVDLARRHGLRVVEDAAQAFGVTFDGRAAGTFGDVGVFSFFSDKVVTMGEGGCVVTNDEDLAAKLALVRNQGRPNSGTFVHPSLGMNFRITDLQAAIGVVQLARMPEIMAARLEKWARYEEGLRGVGDVRLMQRSDRSTIAPFRFPILSGRRDRLMDHLEANGIQTRAFFYPMHLQPRLMENPPVALPVSEKLSAEGICLPIHHHLSIGDVDRIVETIQSFY